MLCMGVYSILLYFTKENCIIIFRNMIIEKRGIWSDEEK